MPKYEKLGMSAEPMRGAGFRVCAIRDGNYVYERNLGCLRDGFPWEQLMVGDIIELISLRREPRIPDGFRWDTYNADDDAFFTTLFKTDYLRTVVVRGMRERIPGRDSSTRSSWSSSRSHSPDSQWQPQSEPPPNPP